MRLDVILRVVSKLIIPFIIVFGLYVQLHGEYSPGGGFQAGVIVAAAVVLHAIIYGLEPAKRMVPPGVAEAMVPVGCLIFAGVGIVSLVQGRNYLDYDGLAADPAAGQVLGVIVVELGVLVTVAGTMIAILFAFAGRGRP